MSTMAVPQDVYNAVAPVAQQYGVPDSVWETVAYQESSFNPKAVGDNGTSFGLFQLHTGGQLPQQYYSDPQAVFDPALNARLAMPAIAFGYQDSGQVQTANLAWWEKFGGISGHPGGQPGVDPANVNEAKALLAKYPLFGTASSAQPTVSLFSNPTAKTSDCCNGDPICQAWINIAGPAACPSPSGSNPAQQAINGLITQGLSALLANIAAQLKPELVKVGVFVLGLALFIFAWFVLLHPDQGGQ